MSELVERGIAIALRADLAGTYIVFTTNFYRRLKNKRPLYVNN